MRSDAQARRNRIIDSACTLFREHAHTVPLETIASHADVGIATLYRNFPDRRALHAACAETLFTQAIALQRDVLERFDDDPQGQWRRYSDELVAMGLGAMVSTFAPVNRDSISPPIAELKKQGDSFGQEIIDAAARHGLIHPSVTHETFFLGLVTVARPPGEGVSAAAPMLTDFLVGVYIDGLKAQAQR